MISRNVTIINSMGLHARPATFFVQSAHKFKSSVWVESGDRKVNAKSLLGVLSLGIAKGMTVTLIADGYDEEEAIASLEKLIDLMAIAPRSRFGIPMGNDFTVWKLDEKIKVDTDEFLSMGRATPFAGDELYGKCVLTVVDGREVYKI